MPHFWNGEIGEDADAEGCAKATRQPAPASLFVGCRVALARSARLLRDLLVEDLVAGHQACPATGPISAIAFDGADFKVGLDGRLTVKVSNFLSVVFAYPSCQAALRRAGRSLCFISSRNCRTSSTFKPSRASKACRIGSFNKSSREGSGFGLFIIDLQYLNRCAAPEYERRVTLVFRF
jgi:hypothetical protein